MNKGILVGCMMFTSLIAAGEKLSPNEEEACANSIISALSTSGWDQSALRRAFPRCYDRWGTAKSEVIALAVTKATKSGDSTLRDQLLDIRRPPLYSQAWQMTGYGLYALALGYVVGRFHASKIASAGTPPSSPPSSSPPFSP